MSLSTRVPSHEDMLSMAAALFESEAQDDLSAGKMAYAWFGKANPLGVPCMVVAMPGTVSDASDCLYLTNRKTPAFRPGMQG